MKNLATIFFLFSTMLAYGQPGLIFSSIGVDYLEINPAYLSKHHIAKVIQREYLKPNFEEIHMLNVFEYNDTGYVTKIIASDPKLGDNIPNDSTFVSKTIYEYELIDSFLYQKELIVRRFNQYGKMNQPDTLSPAVKATHNIYNLKKLINSGSVYKEYVFDNEGRLQSIKKPGVYGNIIALTYDSNILTQVEYSFTGSAKIAFPNKTVKFKYIGDKLVSETQTTSQDERQNWNFKYFYDSSEQMTKKESWINGERISVHTFEYISR